MTADPPICEAAAEVLFEAREAESFIGSLFRSRPRCGKPAAFETALGYRCEACIETYRAALRNPHSVINILAGGVKTDEQIESSIRCIVQ